MPGQIEIFDSNDGGRIQSIVDMHSDFVTFYKDRREIEKRLSNLSSSWNLKIALSGKDEFSYLLVHQGDIEELPTGIHDWIKANRARIVMYSGGSSGDDGVFQRSEVVKSLEEFISRVESGEFDPLQVFTRQPIRGLIQWMNVYQHEYGNLFSPIDYLALLYQGGDIDKAQYKEIKAQLQQRVDAFLATKKGENSSWDSVFERGGSGPDIEQVELDSSGCLSLGDLAPYPVIHIDDEIDKGWDLVFPRVFGNRYISAVSPEEGISKIEQQDGRCCVVLLDLRMPNMSGNLPDRTTGFRTLETIRDRWPTLPVYTFTANIDYGSYAGAIKAGATGYLVKYSRSLETRVDKELYQELWNTFRAGRIENVKHVIFTAFESIPSHENFVSLPKRHYAKRSLSELGVALRHNSFNQLVSESGEAASQSGFLLIAMYRTLENYVDSRESEDPENKPINFNDIWVKLPRFFRNEAAHFNKGKTSRDRVWPGIREVMLSASLLITKWGQLLNDAKWTKDHLDKLSEISLLQAPGPNDIVKCVHDILLDQDDEQIVWPIKAFLRNTNMSDRHALVNTLCADCYDVQNLNSESLFSWFKSDVLCPINSSTIRTSAPAKSPPAAAVQVTSKPMPSPARARNRLRTLDSLFENRNGAYFHRMRKYNGQPLDLGNPGQKSYIEWYYQNHVSQYPDTYEPEVIERFKDWLQGAGDGGGKVEVATETSPNLQTYSVNVLCLEDSSDSSAVLLDQISRATAGTISGSIIRETRSGADSIYENIPDQEGRMTLKGMRLSGPLSIGSRQLFAVSPSALHFNKPQRSIGREWVFDGSIVRKFEPGKDGIGDSLFVQAEGSRPATLDDALKAFDTVKKAAVKYRPSIQGPISWHDLGEIGKYPDTELVDENGNSVDLDKNRDLIGNALNGVRICLVDKTSNPGAIQGLASSIESSAGRPSWTDNPDQADALLVLVDADLDDDQIEALLLELNALERPYQILNPGNFNYKTFGVALGIRSRIGRPIWSLPSSNPGKYFMGLDIGTRVGNESILSVSLFDDRGHLKAWSRIPNKGKGRGPERIDSRAFESVVTRLFNKLFPDDSVTGLNQKLVVHRDGKTLENVEEFISILDDLGTFSSVDWVDVIKNSAPIAFGSSLNKPGLHLRFQNQFHQEQFWNLQSVPTSGRYLRPLTIEQIEGETPGIMLASEIYHLSQVAAHDYLARQKLPVTTYYADGFSKSGSDYLKFAGYEHLRVS